MCRADGVRRRAPSAHSHPGCFSSEPAHGSIGLLRSYRRCRGLKPSPQPTREPASSCSNPRHRRACCNTPPPRSTQAAYKSNHTSPCCSGGTALLPANPVLRAGRPFQGLPSAVPKTGGLPPVWQLVHPVWQPAGSACPPLWEARFLWDQGGFCLCPLFPACLSCWCQRDGVQPCTGHLRLLFSWQWDLA